MKRFVQGGNLERIVCSQAEVLSHDEQDGLESPMMNSHLAGSPSRPLMTVVYGTRPEAIKCAPIIKAFSQDVDLDCSVVLTGQHPEMVAPINQGFGITEDANLDIFAHRQSLAEIAGKTMTRLTPYLRERK
ncbi:MAG: UDP-N-acetylglucosamine 2-epimerase, partial [Propionibacteriaceae bacterium]|nr:UDP-N-acetylglucosamine 2-epimerase [Propionibacteriaceae bacterium]